MQVCIEDEGKADAGWNTNTLIRISLFIYKTPTQECRNRTIF